MNLGLPRASIATARTHGRFFMSSLALSDSTAERTRQMAAFLGLCRRRGLLPRLPAPRLVRIARERLDPVLDDPAVSSDDLAQVVGELEPAVDEPDALGRLHQRRQTARKARGVFYTPASAAAYMARTTLPPRAPAASAPRVLDPACGGGSFLLAAYRHWLAAEPQADPPRRIDLLRSLWGVDLDPLAVMAARRALWLEAVGAGPWPRPGQVAFLAETIRQGDALGGPALDNALGTFDVVLGNPPYRRELGAKCHLDRIARSPLGRRWRAARMDLWHFFLHRGLDLVRDGGRLAYLVSAYWTAGRGAGALVERLRRETHVEEIFDLDALPLFAGVAGRHLIVRLVKAAAPGPTTIKRVPPGRSVAPAAAYLDGAAPLVLFTKSPEALFHDGGIDLEPPCDALMARLARAVPLWRFGAVRQGIAENPAVVNPRTNRRFGGRYTVGQGVFSLSPEELAALDLPPREQALVRPYFDPRDLVRLGWADRPSRRLLYTTARTCPDIDAFPVLRAHLARFRPIMEARRETRQGRRAWWQLHWPREETIWESPKILAVQMAPRPTFVPAAGPAYVPFSVNVFVPAAATGERPGYFAAVLGSRLLWAWFRRRAKRRGVALEINGRVLADAPIRPIDPTDAADRAGHDELVALIEATPRASTPDARREIQRRIDQIVERLYDLSPHEIAELERDTPTT